jgi:hypothetical protein
MSLLLLLQLQQSVNAFSLHPARCTAATLQQPGELSSTALGAVPPKKAPVTSKNNNKNTMKNAKATTTTTSNGPTAKDILTWISPLNPYMLFVYPLVFIFLVDALHLGPSSR